jgi:membrane-bound metal-dependent hydrolase YbcI (DUF457 family)
MVDVPGHLGLALLVASIAWFAYRRHAALTFVALAVPFGLLPDIDLYLRKIFPTVHHHGITHTIAFVTAVSVVVGAILAPTLIPYLRDRDWLSGDSIGNPYAFTIGALLLGGLSHLFGDMLSAPDISQPIEPFWPFLNQPITLDVIYYTSNLWNYGLLVAGLLVNLGLWAWSRQNSRTSATRS